MTRTASRPTTSSGCGGSTSLADEAYSYDAVGNRTLAGYVTGSDNRLLSDGAYDYTYDDEGNRLTRTDLVTGETVEYAWDHRNHLAGLTVRPAAGAAASGRVRYTYDANDRRIAKELDADGGGAYESAERFAYDGAGLVLMANASGVVTGRLLGTLGPSRPCCP